MSNRISLLLLLSCFPMMMTLSGCSIEAIWVSRSVIDFDRDTNPQFFQVASFNGAVGTINVTITPGKSWIKVSPELVECLPPDQGAQQKTTVEVQIDRSRITSIGSHEGTIQLSAPGVKTVEIQVKAYQDSLTEPMDPLNIINPLTVFSTPYLVEFAFSLRDENNRAVTGEPAQFQVSAKEDDTPVGRPEGLLIWRAAARQVWMELVLDYSAFMQEIDGAIPAMEEAATQMLLPSLNEDVLVAVSGFYRDNENSKLITPYTVDRQYAEDSIAAIQTTHLTGFASGAKVYEALMSAMLRLDEIGTSEKDDKYFVLFCNGRDTSSTITVQEVINAAKSRGVRIIVVGFGESINSGEIITLAQSTGGRYVSAASLDELQSYFERVIEDLNAQYVVRWATARQDATYVRPSFSLVYGDASASYTSPRTFRGRDIAGDRLQGELVLVQSDAPGNTTVFLRADYIPREISAFRFRVGSSYNVTTSLVGIADDGLLGGWTKTETEDAGILEITIDGGGVPLPFASFGAMLRFDFDQVVDNPFTSFEVDNTLYGDGQNFVVE